MKPRNGCGCDVLPAQRELDLALLELQPEDFEFPIGLGDEWEKEVSRNSAIYLRWVQNSLNRVIGLRLKVDGIPGPQTRSAIRRFQQRQGLVVDGVVGPQTEASLIAAGAAPPPQILAPADSLESIRWVQTALNQILGLRLAMDGVMGRQTRSAIRSFQQKQGLAVTGDVDSQTTQRLVAALSGPVVAGSSCAIQPCEILEKFDFDKDRVLSSHQPEIIDIARCVIASQKTSGPIRSIRIVGHTDTEGSAAYNLDLGRRRANEVRRQLIDTLNRILPGSSGSVAVVAHTRGEMQPVSSDPAKNRRVQVFVPVKVKPTPLPCYTCGNFFAEYDLRFLPRNSTRGVEANPDMTRQERDQRTAEVDAMTILPGPPRSLGLLLIRRNRRAADALSGAVPSPAPAPSSLDAAVRSLSTAQLDLYRETFPDGAGGINFAAFRKCFTQFANGELRVGGGGVGEPNGGFYFLFAEFAFLCVDSGIDAGEWTRALRVFVMTQEIFMHVYRPRPIPLTPPAVGASLPTCSPPRGPRSLDVFLDTNFQKTGRQENVGAGQSDSARKRALRTKYAPMDPRALEKAAGENMLRAQCMP